MTTQYSNRILIVDDDVNLLAAVTRQLRNKFSISTAVGPTEALCKLETGGPFAVAISDMRMPDMNGIQFLTKVHDRYPDTVRIMLTGHADVDVATHAVNETNIFRFLVKPCHRDTMEWAIEAGIKQYRLVVAERELLENTLKSSVQILVDILSLVNPLAFSRSARLKKYVRQMGKLLNIRKMWQLELATLLSQIGCITLGADTLAKSYAGEELSSDEQKMFLSHPGVGRDLIAKIPRLEAVATIIGNQLKGLDEYNLSDNSFHQDESIVSAQILKIATDFDTLISRGFPRSRAISELKKRENIYHPIILGVLNDIEVIDVDMEIKVVDIQDLNNSMVLAEDIRTLSDILIAAKGQEVSLSMRTMLRSFLERKEIKAEARVFIPRSCMNEEISEPIQTAV